uniref:Uncharacterized protein n=1 Tax=Anguilla anguilla TaxID=7936 RepID=A0A0E9PHM9_ANGAN
MDTKQQPESALAAPSSRADAHPSQTEGFGF